MVFSSLTFICVFLPAALAASLVVRRTGPQTVLLALASLLFYAYGEPVGVLLMLVSTLANWALGLAVGAARGMENGAHAQGSAAGARAKALLVLAVAGNLLCLGFFKYADLLVSTVNELFGLGVSGLGISLPIGISFYTFQAMSYVIDVYRGQAEPQRSYVKVLFYIAFFPQLIAGPIVRYRDIEEQIDHRSVTLEGVATGFRRFVVGLAKKVLIANVMAEAADAVFGASASELNVAVAWIGAVAYLFQIYFDFSGYSDMAIGLARMFGFTFQENFRHPYAAASVQEFWRRWHVSLSTWFKEYLYIPLGGNRRGRARAALNKIVVFFCCGLWHGAAWTYAAWGLVHGFFLLMEEYLPVRRLHKALGWLYTMLVVTFAFVLFGAGSFEQALLIMGQMIGGFHFERACMAMAAEQLTPLFIATLAVAAIAVQPWGERMWLRLQDGPCALVADVAGYLGAAALLALCLLELSSGGYNPFIYFRF